MPAVVDEREFGSCVTAVTTVFAVALDGHAVRSVDTPV
jgi:hypothetical protein